MTPISRLLSLVPDGPGRARGDLLSREAFAPGADDCFVNTAVKNAILRERGLAHAGILVSTSRGVVQLSGFVGSREVITRAVAAARGVAGVRTVRNDMRRR